MTGECPNPSTICRNGHEFTVPCGRWACEVCSEQVVTEQMQAVRSGHPEHVLTLDLQASQFDDPADADTPILKMVTEFISNVRAICGPTEYRRWVVWREDNDLPRVLLFLRCAGLHSLNWKEVQAAWMRAGGSSQVGYAPGSQVLLRDLLSDGVRVHPRHVLLKGYRRVCGSRGWNIHKAIGECVGIGQRF